MLLAAVLAFEHGEESASFMEWEDTDLLKFHVCQ